MRSGSLDVGIHFGQLASYLRTMLHERRGFVAMNLDVEGSYRTQLDATMSYVLAFCFANPRTVVAMHSTIGRRDMYNIYEGIRALYLLYWLAEDSAIDAFAALIHGYMQCGSTVPIRFALRDVFWLTSQIEHILCSSVAVGCLDKEYVSEFGRCCDSLFAHARSVRRRRFLLRNVLEDVRIWSTSVGAYGEGVLNMPVYVGIERLAHVYYNAQRPWSQCCYVVRYESYHTRPGVLHEVARALCSLVRSIPFQYVDRQGIRRHIGRDGSSLSDGVCLLGESKYLREFYRVFTPRVIPIIQLDEAGGRS